MKIIKRLLYILLALPVFFIWAIAALLSPFYWILTGDEEILANKFATHSYKLSLYLRDKNGSSF